MKRKIPIDILDKRYQAPATIRHHQKVLDLSGIHQFAHLHSVKRGKLQTINSQITNNQIRKRIPP